MKMLGKSTKFSCSCCREDTKVRDKRRQRRREKQALKKEIG